MTVIYIPALLPMVPGIYAYKVVLSLLLFFHHINDASASQYIENTIANSLVTFTTIFNLAVGATLPVLINKNGLLPHQRTKAGRNENKIFI